MTDLQTTTSATTDLLLDEIIHGDGRPRSSFPSTLPPPTREVQAKRHNYSHMQMIDLILANPGISQNEIAVRIGYSASWVSRIMVSDAFQALLAERSKEIVDPALRATVEDNFKAIVLRSQEVLMAKLNSTPDQIPDQLVLRSLEVSSKALGYGARPMTLVAPQAMMEHLEALGGNLVTLFKRTKATHESEALDGEFTDAIPKSEG